MRVLLTADWHLRGDAPACRKHPELWLEEQAAAVRAVYDVCKAKAVDELWIAGDLFHRARTATEATVQALQLLSRFPCTVRVLPGNHDLRYHSYENLSRSTVGTIFSLQGVKELKSFEHPISWGSDAKSLRIEAYPFGTEPESIPSCDIWVLHALVFPDEASRPPTEKGVIAEELLEKSDAKVIVTGDYHHGSLLQFGDRKVVTCGCLTIQTRDMAGYQPRVYILDTDTLDVEEVRIGQFGELDLEAPTLEDANGYAETLHLAQLPKIDFRAAIEAATSKADPEVKGKAQEILDGYDLSKIS